MGTIKLHGTLSVSRIWRCDIIVTDLNRKFDTADSFTGTKMEKFQTCTSDAGSEFALTTFALPVLFFR